MCGNQCLQQPSDFTLEKFCDGFVMCITFPMHGLGTLKFYVTDKTFQKD